MIGFKKSPNKLVLGIFIVSAILILLIYIDSEINKPVPVEEISIIEEINESLPMIKNTVFHEVKKGESLSVIFEEKEIPLNTAYKIFNFDKDNLLSSIRPGDKMEFNYLNEDLINIEIIKDKINSILIDLSKDVLIKKQEKIIQNIKSFNKGKIKSSFYQDALKAGMPESIIMDFVYIFGWDVDFIFDVRKGDEFSVIFETEYTEGEQISNGDIRRFTQKNQNLHNILESFFKGPARFCIYKLSL